MKSFSRYFASFAGLLFSLPVFAAPTFNKDIAPIIFQNCTVCHRAGEVAPFPLTNYHEVAKRAKQIARVTHEKVMPPWKAEKGFYDFANERQLTAAQIALVKEWNDSGAAEGNASDLAAMPKFPDGWTLGEPDLILEPSESYQVAAEGRDVYRCFVIPTELTEDKYISALEVRPGNRQVVHHVIAHVDTTGKARELDAKDPGPGYTTFGGIGFRSGEQIGGWAPGNFPIRAPDGLGTLIPKGADVVLQVHYHKTGKSETDRTRVGLYFTKTPVDKRLRVYSLMKLPLRLPAGESNYLVHATLPVMFDTTLYRVMPHMHLIGHDIKVTVTFPDGTAHPLVDVPEWDFNWQTTYEYKKPIKVPRGSRVDMEAHFNNSESNPVNPNHPPRLVTFGEQTTDEMCIAFLSYTLDQEHLTKGIAGRKKQ